MGPPEYTHIRILGRGQFSDEERYSILCLRIPPCLGKTGKQRLALEGESCFRLDAESGAVVHDKFIAAGNYISRLDAYCERREAKYKRQARKQNIGQDRTSFLFCIAQIRYLEP